MTPIDSRLLFQLLPKMCSEIRRESLEYLLSTKPSTVDRLFDGRNGNAYWPREKDWIKNAEAYNQRRVPDKTCREVGIRKLINCCPRPGIEVTSLEERLSDLIDSIFTEYYDYDISIIKEDLCKRLFELDAPPKDIAHIESLTNPQDIATFLALRARDEGLNARKTKKRNANI